MNLLIFGHPVEARQGYRCPDFLEISRLFGDLGNDRCEDKVSSCFKQVGDATLMPLWHH